MYGFIFGFQRLVWWPKWTPASIMSRMVSGVSRDGISETDEDGDSVVVSMFSFRVVSSADVIEFHHRGASTDGTRGSLDQRVVLKEVRFLPQFPHQTRKTSDFSGLPLRPPTC